MTNDSSELRTLGVTGGIGSGKSEVCRILESLGARVFYADDQAKRIMAEHAGVRREIVDAFGDASYREDGTLDRAYLARQIFGDPERVAQVNAIVHPRVAEAFMAMKARAIEDDIPLLVHEAALIFESGADKRLDAVAVVHSPAAERIRRVTRRDRVEPAQVEARMKHQLPEEELLRRADYVIENSGTLEELRERVTALYEVLLNRAV